MTAHELIEKYKFILVGSENISTFLKPSANAIAEIKAAKPEIIKILLSEKMEKETAMRERQTKIAAIPGLKELESSIANQIDYRQKLTDAFENEYTPVESVHRVENNISVLLKKFPRAAAYLLAEQWSHSENFKKSALGKEAKEKIINGGDFNAAIQKMKDEWQTECGLLAQEI